MGVCTAGKRPCMWLAFRESYYISLLLFLLKITSCQFSWKVGRPQIAGQVRLFMRLGRIPHTIVCVKSLLRQQWRLLVSTQVREKRRPPFVEKKRHNIEIGEGSMADTNRKRLHERAITKRKRGCLLYCTSKHRVDCSEPLEKVFSWKLTMDVRTIFVTPCRCTEFSNVAREMKGITNTGDAHLITQCA